MKSEYFVLLPNDICFSLQSFSAIALKKKKLDENFVTAKCACIDDRATLTKSAIVHERQDSYGPEKILKFLMNVMPIGYNGRK